MDSKGNLYGTTSSCGAYGQMGMVARCGRLRRKAVASCRLSVADCDRSRRPTMWNFGVRHPDSADLMGNKSRKGESS